MEVGHVAKNLKVRKIEASAAQNAAKNSAELNIAMEVHAALYVRSKIRLIAICRQKLLYEYSRLYDLNHCRTAQ